MSARVAVVMPTFNRAVLLERAVRSALAQTMTSFELHIVDDGSSDDTTRVLERLAAEDARVHWQRQDNAGPAKARRAAVAASTAEWITFLDDDDYWLPTHLAVRCSLSERFPAIELWQGGFIVEGDQYTTDYFNHDKRIHIDATVVGGTFFVRRRVFDALDGFAEVAWAEDTEFWQRALKRFACGHLREPRTYVYHRQVGSRSTSL